MSKRKSVTRERESECFAFSPVEGCTALKNNHGYSCNSKCPFFKSKETITREQIEDDIAAYGGADRKKNVINTAKVKEYAVSMTKKAISKEMRHETCQYSNKNKGGSRYCHLTTNKSCAKCTFYDPTIHAVVQVMATETEKAIRTKESLDALFTNAEYLSEVFGHIKKEAEVEYEQLHVARFDLVQLWQDSVNTYE